MTGHLSDWSTAADWAQRKLKGLPRTKQGILDLAAREGWTSRPRAGRGGGREYPLQALPQVARDDYERRQAREAQRLSGGDLCRQTAATPTTALTGRQRSIMEARAAVLVEIDRRVLVEGLSRRQAVLALIGDYEAASLPVDLMRAARTANDKGRGLSRSSLYSWLADRDAGGPALLAPQVTRRPEPLPTWFRDFLTYFASPQKRTIAHALDLWQRAASDTALPSYRQVRNALGKLGAVDRHRGRVSAQELKSLQAYRSRDTSELLPTSVYIADGKTLVAEVAHPIHGQPFRPEITTILDVHTRRVVGWSASLDESAAGVSEALRVACTTSGIPAIFYSDRGPGYVNEAMDAPLTGLLGRLGCQSMRAWPYNAQAKGIIERFNRHWTDLSRELPTYIGRDMDKMAGTRIHHQTRRDLALVGASRLLIAWPEFLQAAGDLVSRYNAAPHSGLPRVIDRLTGAARHLSPDEMWARAIDSGFEPVLPDEMEAADLFRPWVVRKARRCLIEFMGNSYFADALEPYHGEEMIVGYDIHDASRVWVREIRHVDGECQPGRLIAIATFEGNRTRYVPVSVEQQAMERRAAARRARLNHKLDLVEAELRPAALLEGSRTMLAVRLDQPAPVLARVEAKSGPAAPIGIRPDGRPIFRTDQDFARWLIAHPASATEADRDYIAELLSSPASQTELRISGIDLEALRSIARSAA